MDVSSQKFHLSITYAKPSFGAYFISLKLALLEFSEYCDGHMNSCSSWRTFLNWLEINAFFLSLITRIKNFMLLRILIISVSPFLILLSNKLLISSSCYYYCLQTTGEVCVILFNNESSSMKLSNALGRFLQLFIITPSKFVIDDLILTKVRFEFSQSPSYAVKSTAYHFLNRHLSYHIAPAVTPSTI